MPELLHRRAPQCANPVQTVRPNRAPLTPRASAGGRSPVAAALTVVLVAGTACGPDRVEALAASGGPDDRAAPIDKAVQDLMAATRIWAPSSWRSPTMVDRCSPRPTANR